MTMSVKDNRMHKVLDEMGRLLESNLLLNLNEPNAIGDTSWIRTGKTTWHWWNGTAGEPAGFAPGLDYRTMAHYVDFCARHGIAFHALVAGPRDVPWYVQGRRGLAPRPDTNLMAARPELELERLLAERERKLERGEEFEEDLEIRATTGPDGLEVEVLDEPSAPGGDA